MTTAWKMARMAPKMGDKAHDNDADDEGYLEGDDVKGKNNGDEVGRRRR